MTFALRRDRNKPGVGPQFEYCRLCVKTFDRRNMKSIFEDAGESGSLAEAIRSVTNLQVKSGDGLPSYICKYCIAQLYFARNCINKCTAGDDFLRNHMFQLTEEPSTGRQLYVKKPPKATTEAGCSSAADGTSTGALEAAAVAQNAEKSPPSPPVAQR